MFNNENTPSIAQLVRSISMTDAELRCIQEPELEIALTSALQTLS